MLQDHSLGTVWGTNTTRSRIQPEAEVEHDRITGNDLSIELWTMIAGMAMKSTMWWEQLECASRLCLVNRAWSMANQRRRYKYAFLTAYYVTYDALKFAELLNHNRALATLDVLRSQYVLGAMRCLRYGLNDMLKEMKHSYCDTNDTCVKDGDAHHLHQVIVESRQQIILIRNMRDNRILVDRFYSIASDPAQIRQKIVTGHNYPGSHRNFFLYDCILP